MLNNAGAPASESSGSSGLLAAGLAILGVGVASAASNRGVAPAKGYDGAQGAKGNFKARKQVRSQGSCTAQTRISCKKCMTSMSLGNLNRVAEASERPGMCGNRASCLHDVSDRRATQGISEPVAVVLEHRLPPKQSTGCHARPNT